jgi:hypothetical protein
MATAFNILFAGATFAAIVAFLRMRTGVFFIAANAAIALRAFANIAQFGQPDSQSFLPRGLFSEARLESAAWIFVIVVPLSLLFAILPSPPATHGRKQPAPNLPPLPRWVLILLALYFLVYIASMRTILAGAYASEGQIRFEAPAGGVQALMVGLVTYELYRRVRDAGMSPFTAFAILAGLFLLTDYSKGATGFATGFLLNGAFLFFSTRTTARRRLLPLVCIVLTIATLALVIRAVRQRLHDDGTEVLASATSGLVTAETDRERNAEGIEERSNGAQIAAHTLECVWLYESGHDRGWRSLYNPILYTFQPAFLLKALDMTRPREAAWELGDYFIHGGGIFVFGELYWNGGYFCVFSMTLALLLTTWYVDVSRYRSIAALVLACQFTPALLQGTQYGVAYGIRGLSNGLIALLILKLLNYARRRVPIATPELTGDRLRGPAE